METTLLVQAGLGLLLLVVVACLVAAIRARRHLSTLRTMGARHGLGLVSGAPQARAIQLARRYASEPRRVKLRDVLRGDDGDGCFYLARRRSRRVDHHCLFCETPDSTHVQGFHVRPVPSRGGARSGRGRAEGRAFAPRDDGSYDLRWTVPRAAWTENRSLGVAARVLGAVARMGEEDGAVPMGVEIHDRNLIVHALRPLRGRELDRFVEDAIRLRRQVLSALRAVEGRHASDGPSGASAARRRSSPASIPTSDVAVVVLGRG